MIKSFLTYQIYLIIIFIYLNLITTLLPINNNYIHPLIILTNLFFIILFSLYNFNIYIKNNWFAYITFLIIIGGIIIIFIYFIRFLNNIKISINLNQSKIFFLKLILITIFIYNLLKYENYIWFNKFDEIIPLINNLNFNNYLENFSLIYLYPKNWLTLFVILYLFICITIIVKICLKKKLSLRKIN